MTDYVLHLSLVIVFAYLHFRRNFGEDVNYFGPQAYCPVGIQKYLNKSQNRAVFNYLFIPIHLQCHIK